MRVKSAMSKLLAIVVGAGEGLGGSLTATYTTTSSTWTHELDLRLQSEIF